MKKPYLVQRIDRPRNFDLAMPEGYPRQDLTHRWTESDSEAKKADVAAGEFVKNWFKLDYMGYAEFEFGAVPEAIEKFIKKNVIKTNLRLEVKAVKAGFGPLVPLNAPIWVEFTIFSSADDARDVADFITRQVYGLDAEDRLKDRTCLDSATGRYEDKRSARGRTDLVTRKSGRQKLLFSPPENTGWFDLENLWMATTLPEQAKAWEFIFGKKSAE